MRLEDFGFDLPDRLIATRPVRPRSGYCLNNCGTLHRFKLLQFRT